MARLGTDLIAALRTTATRLRAGADYEWGHAGACNCGHLAQTVTGLDRAAIYRQVGGEWNDYLHEHCPVTGDRVEDVATVMIRFGFEPSELAALELLSDDEVLRQLPGGHRWLARNEREDVVAYLEAWADLLERRKRDENDARAAAKVA